MSAIRYRTFCKEEIHAVLKYSVLPVTINMMEFFKPLDYFKFAPQLDIISWDSYPEWHSKKDEVDIGSAGGGLPYAYAQPEKSAFPPDGKHALHRELEACEYPEASGAA